MYFLCKNKEEFEEKKDIVKYKLTYKSGEEERLYLINNKKGNPLSCI